MADRKSNRSPLEPSNHGEVRFEEEVVRLNAVKELNGSGSGHNDMKETLKRTNTPNFRKNFVHEAKFYEEDGQIDHNHDSDEDSKSGHDNVKNPLMKVPTFSRNITSQTINKKNQLKTSSFVVEPLESNDDKVLISLKVKEDGKSIRKEERDVDINPNLYNSGQQSPQKTRFFQNSKQKEGQSHSPKDFVGHIPLKTANSSGSNFNNNSPSNQMQKSPSNQQKTIEAIENYGKSLDKICEEESELASSEKKKSKKPSIITNVNSNILTKMSLKNSPKENKEIKFPANNFKVNLIDFFRNEQVQTIQMTSSFMSRNSKKNFSNNPKSYQSIPSNLEINKDLSPEKTNAQGSKFFHINPNANLISMFKNELEPQNLNLGEDDNHNFVTIDEDGPSPINHPSILQNEMEPERETSLNISTFENVISNDATNSNMEKSEINRTTLNNADDISKDLSKYSINADYLNVEYDDKKGRDPSPSNNNNILSGLNSPINQQPGQSSHPKSLGFSTMKLSSKIHKPVEENKFLSPTVQKKASKQKASHKFELRSYTMNERDDSAGEEKPISNYRNDLNVSNNNINNPELSKSTVNYSNKKLENNKLNISNIMNKAPNGSKSGKLQRAKTTLEAENSVVHTSKLDVTKDEQGNKKINQYLMMKDLGRLIFKCFFEV